LKTEEFLKKTFRIFRYFKSSEIRYIIHNYIQNEIENSLIYLIVNTGDNYFFSLDYDSGKITELNLPKEIGLGPTFQKLNNYFFITIGGINGNSNTVNLYDIYNNKWYYVGNLSSSRSGAYAVLNCEDNLVYICGGMNSDGDNTFDIEYFNLEYPMGSEISSGVYPTELKIKNIKNDFLLRKINPVVLPLMEENSYLICGGSNIFQDTVTCTIFYADRDFVSLTNNLLPKTFKNSPNNQNIMCYKNSLYFFIGENEVIRYSLLENAFEIIQHELTVN
jgi:hypothetical protein